MVESGDSGGDRPLIGLAISGGGHRATVWGTGVLLYLVDAGRNREVTAIASVSGGSILNGVVAHEMDFREVSPEEFRQRIRPLLRHVAEEGLFFFGAATNPYVRRVMAILAAVGVLTLVLAGVAGATLLGALWDPAWPEGLGLREVGVAVGVVCWAMAWKLSRVGTKDRVEPDRVLVGALGLAGALGMALGVLGWTLGWNPTLQVRTGLGWLVIAWLVLVVVALYVLESRSRVADGALARTHFGGGGPGAGPTDLDHVARSVTHVFCATELQSGDHAYFSPRFVYSYRHGIAPPPPGLWLSTAVQASACLPGAFVPRRIDVSGYGMERSYLDAEDREPPERPRAMVLTDGGVYDNMADQWFQGLPARLERVPALADKAHRPVDVLLVANASGGWVWRAIRVTRWRTLRELTAISRVKSIMYDATTSHRRQGLIGQFRAAEARGRGMRGTLVHIPQSPFRVADGFRKSRDPVLRARAEEVIGHLSETTRGEWEEVARLNTEVETVLRALGRATTARLLRHAYVLAMCNAHVLFGWGVRSILTDEEFERLI